MRLAEIKAPENRYYYFHDNSSLDLCPEKSFLKKREFGELKVFLTIPSWSVPLITIVITRGGDISLCRIFLRP